MQIAALSFLAWERLFCGLERASLMAAFARLGDHIMRFIAALAALHLGIACRIGRIDRHRAVFRGCDNLRFAKRVADADVHRKAPLSR